MQTPVSSSSKSQDKPIHIAAVIPVHNRRETTLQCLRSLSRIDRTGLDLRVFVVDDGSRDGTSDAIRRQFPDVRIIEGSGDLHYAGGTNAGIAAARQGKPDFYLLMNDDAVFHEQFLRRLVETASRNRRSVVGALLLLWDEPHRVFQVGQVWRTWSGGWQIPQDLTAFSVPEQAFDVECLVGNCVLVPAAAIEECGVMDDKTFPHGWGDAQYIMRLRKSGWRLLLEPRSYVWCEPNTYPPPLHTVGFREALKILFVNERHPANLRRQFLARRESAPKGRLQATAAFAVYCGQLILKAVTGSTRKTS